MIKLCRFIKKNELKKVQDELTDLAQKLNSAVEANKRAEEIKQKQDFYRLQLTTIDLEEIRIIFGEFAI